MSNPYSPDKIAYHRQWLDGVRGDHPTAPIHVQLIPTNLCNHRCKFCAYRQPGYTSNAGSCETHTIPEHRLLSLVDELWSTGIKAVQVTGGGEPTVHPHFLRLCEKIVDGGMDLAVVSNGTLLKGGHCATLKRAQWIRISLDAANDKTYAELRNVRPEAFHCARRAVRMLAGTGPTLGVGFVVNRDNWSEVSQAAYNAREDGVDNIRISAVFQNEGDVYFSKFRKRAERECKVARDAATPKFRVLDLFRDRLSDLEQGRPSYNHCHYSRACTYIGADMNVYRCCVYAYHPDGLLGSIADRTFTALWHDKETQRRLKEFNARQCERCMFNNKNRAIQAALDGRLNPSDDLPEHVNFV